MRLASPLLLVVVAGLISTCSAQTARESQKAGYEARKAKVLEARRAAYKANKESKAKAYAARKAAHRD